MNGPDVERWGRQAAATGAWLFQARWFGAVAAGGPPRLADGCAAADADLLLVEADTAEGPVRYVTPVAGPAALDAACTVGFARWLVDVVRGGREIAGIHGRFVGHPVGSPPGPAAGPADDVEPLGADASNTSCRVRTADGGLVVKLLRHCRAGIQPEVEIGGFFATQSPWSGTPALRGWLEYRPHAGGDAVVLATLHDQLSGCASAWEVLGGLLQEGGLDGPHGGRIRGLVASLGTVTAAMHAALAARPDIAAFAPVRVTPDERGAFAAAAVANAGDVLGLAAARAAAAAEPLAGRLRRMLGRRETILARLGDAGAALPDWLIRVHGDYHLGQVLVSPPDDRVFVIDFEGEPGRPLETRRRAAPAARDIAGMCRSFDYLVRAVGVVDPNGSAAALEHGFRSAYEAETRDRGWARGTESLLAILKLDKALYELAYELRHRPEWAAIPLAGIEAAVG